MKFIRQQKILKSARMIGQVMNTMTPLHLGDSHKQSILVVDDSRVQRKIVAANLKRWGFEIFEAESGREALEICQKHAINFVLSDWMMPEMDGLEFCKAYRDLPRDRYGYFILLTSKSEKDEVAAGLEAGADDFLSKPVNSSELRARIMAGERVLRMEDELQSQKNALSDTLDELQNVYNEINKDLAEAEKFQHSLMPELEHKFDQGTVTMLLQSSGHVGGDIAGFFSFDENHLGMYSVDVSGHGISSALMTARVATYFSAHSKGQNVAYKRLDGGEYGLRTPAEIAEILNDRLIEEIDTDLYFTLAFAHLNLVTGQVDMVQAGHPHPVIYDDKGSVRFEGTGGPPIGLVEGMKFENFSIKLNAGERLLLHSDGITECQNDVDDLLDEEGLAKILRKHGSSKGNELISDIIWELTEFAKGVPFGDDISAILFEYEG